MNNNQNNGQNGRGQNGQNGQQNQNGNGEPKVTKVGHQGTNENDVRIKELDVQAKKELATNEWDLRVAELKARSEELGLQIKQNVEMHRINVEAEMNQNNNLTAIAKWGIGCVTVAAVILTNAAFNVGLEMKKLESGR